MSIHGVVTLFCCRYYIFFIGLSALYNFAFVLLSRISALAESDTDQRIVYTITCSLVGKVLAFRSNLLLFHMT